MSQVGIVVRNARAAKGWSQTHLALAAGLSKRTVIRVETGASVSGESLLALGAALEIDLTEVRPERSGRTLIVDLPDVLMPAWLGKVMAPLGQDHAPWTNVLVYLVLVLVSYQHQIVERYLGDGTGSVWFEAWGLAIFLYTLLLSAWLLAFMLDDWLSGSGDVGSPGSRRVDLTRTPKA